MKAFQQDVIIIGSGFGGAVPALRFAKKGLRVTILEKGPRINPFKDFKQTQDPKYLLKYMKGTTGENVHLSHAEALGGGSGFYETVSLRTPSFIFQKKDAQGQKHWPEGLSRKTLDPFYKRGEEMLNIHQIAPHEVPKSGQVFAQIMQKLGRTADRSRYAVKGCVNSGYCVTGCVYGAKQSLLLNYLPQAEKAGAQILTNSEVTGIQTNPRSAYKYIVFFNNGKDKRTLHTKVLILAAGTVGTAKILMQSKPDLPNLSNQVGKNVTFNGSIKQLFITPDWCQDADMFTGRSNPGVLSYDFLESDNIMLTVGKIMPLHLFGVARTYVPGKENVYWGHEHVNLIKKLRRRIMILVAQGYTEPYCSLSFNRKGKLEIYAESKSHLEEFNQNGTRILTKLIHSSGGTTISTDFMRRNGLPFPKLHFSSTHQLGSCRMADTPDRGVVNSNGEVYGYPGMYVTDGAAIPSSLIVNPSLTILANAERITKGILDRLSAI
jgi:choline dehydrogenase-like flavoprotein